MTNTNNITRIEEIELKRKKLKELRDKTRTLLYESENIVTLPDNHFNQNDKDNKNTNDKSIILENSKIELISAGVQTEKGDINTNIVEPINKEPDILLYNKSIQTDSIEIDVKNKQKYDFESRDIEKTIIKKIDTTKDTKLGLTDQDKQTENSNNIHNDKADANNNNNNNIIRLTYSYNDSSLLLNNNNYTEAYGDDRDDPITFSYQYFKGKTAISNTQINKKFGKNILSYEMMDLPLLIDNEEFNLYSQKELAPRGHNEGKCVIRCTWLTSFYDFALAIFSVTSENINGNMNYLKEKDIIVSFTFIFRVSENKIIDMLQFPNERILRGEFLSTIDSYSPSILSILLTTYTGSVILYELRNSTEDDSNLSIERNLVWKNYHNAPINCIYYNDQLDLLLTSSSNGKICKLNRLNLKLHNIFVVQNSMNDSIITDQDSANKDKALSDWIDIIERYNEINITCFQCLNQNVLIFGDECGGIYRIPLYQANTDTVAINKDNILIPNAHDGYISDLAINTFDDGNTNTFILLSSSIDGCIKTWEVSNTESGSAKLLYKIELLHPVIQSTWINKDIFVVMTNKDLSFYHLKDSLAYPLTVINGDSFTCFNVINFKEDEQKVEDNHLIVTCLIGSKNCSDKYCTLQKYKLILKY
ncbi:uncharacterized protein SCODWIG_03618 [Saccharomycodes ludwigii]|uniref:Uncharacterized protein n=1 Tax=Saccharomycodes ludwigii TaxID=36035 RepID=A0A376BB52_9ASCO|nr:hypothetical protein SCDLUD_002581 [Saccharomycodes ludwigii]KAH3901103.1 hypothetical protein SCDLUD_002581 [Saccharomycodes ludwigii]SSD61857.1 uncharacterized protein SCODWIG_03618 [Saccharomycodes ludwigii]